MNIRKGMLITFEGGEGAGKTTQIELLRKKLIEAGHDVVTTREPGGVPEAEKIRDLLVKSDGGNWDPLSECLLFFTARRMHVETLIKPALEAGKIVISDRFTDSTIAYQGYGHGFEMDLILKTKKLSIDNFQPDITFLLDLPVTEGLQRSKRRLAEADSNEDKFENLDLSFHERLRGGFLEIAKNEPERVTVINAQDDIETISQNIWDSLK